MSEVDPYEAVDIASRLRGITHTADAALTDEELDTIVMAANRLEAAVGVETGEMLMRSSMTGTTYLVTKWVPRDDGSATSLEKTKVTLEDLDDENLREQYHRMQADTSAYKRGYSDE